MNIQKMGEALKVDPARASALVSQLQAVRGRIAIAAANGREVRLVAVSKLKPANDILALHESPSVRQLHFGENYAQDLGKKAQLLPQSIRWHFIGGLQSNHCKALAKIPNLWCVSSVDTLKKAQLLDKVRGELIASSTSASDANSSPPSSRPPPSPSSPVAPLRIHVQVNTSGEEAKSGCAPGADTVALCWAVEADCPHLVLAGLMTIGAIARSRASGSTGAENEDFRLLGEQRDLVAHELGLDGGGGTGRELELSMGMSEDFETAIAMGSGEVRVGSTIFGERPAKADAKLVA